MRAWFNRPLNASTPPGLWQAPLLAAALLGVVSCGGGAEETQPAAPPAAVVEVAEAAPLGAGSLVQASGLVAYKRETPLAFNVPGVIASLNVDEGQVVRAGQRLAGLRQTQVQAGTAEASAALETAERNLARTQTLFDRGLVAQARLDDATLAVERARAARQSAGFTQDTSVLNAPASGVILRRLAEPAQVVGAGSPVLVLGETGSGLIVRAGLTSDQVRRIRIGSDVTVTIAGVPEARRGRVSLIASASNAATGGFDVEIQVPSTDGLRSGAVASVEIVAQTQADATTLAVPLLALLDARADQGVVYVVGADNVARRRSIQTSGVEGETVLVAAGLAAGERVISKGAAFVRDGETVSIAAPATAP